MSTVKQSKSLNKIPAKIVSKIMKPVGGKSITNRNNHIREGKRYGLLELNLLSQNPNPHKPMREREREASKKKDAIFFFLIFFWQDFLFLNLVFLFIYILSINLLRLFFRKKNLWPLYNWWRATYIADDLIMRMISMDWFSTDLCEIKISGIMWFFLFV